MLTCVHNWRLTMDQSIDFYKLAESIGDLEKLKTKLIENGVVTRQMLQSAMMGCRSVEDEKLHIVLEFKKKSPDALKKFFSYLVEAEQSDAAKIMDPSYQVPIKNLHNTRDDTTDASVTRVCVQQATHYVDDDEKFMGCRSVEDEKLHIVLEFKKKSPDALKKFFSYLVEAEQSDAAKIMDPSYQVPIKNLHNTRDDTTDASVTRVCVQQATHYVDDDEKFVYRMKSSPKGYALVIVNLMFTEHLYRNGAEMDCSMLTLLFQGLGYRVSAYFNLTSQEMEEITKNFAASMDFSLVDSCIVAISTYGEGEFLVGSDSSIMRMEKIIEPFNNRNCPKLTHKPKLFFLQACRGGCSRNPDKTSRFQYDEYRVMNGFDITSTVRLGANDAAKRDKYDHEVLERTDGNTQTKVASFTDMWIFHFTTPEYVSWRNKNERSRLVVAVTEVFSKNAWNTELYQLYIKVVKMMQDLGNEPRKAMRFPELSLRGFLKKFYFNPGLNETVV